MTNSALLPLLIPGPTRVGSLAAAAAPLAATTRCLAVEEYFQSQPELTSVLVVDRKHPASVGLVSRSRFLQVISGRFGFGRALYQNVPIAQLAIWDPVVIDTDATIQQAAAAVLHRSGDARYDDLAVRSPDGGWSTLTAAAVFEALARKLAEQAMFDGLTGLANRELLLAELALRCGQLDRARTVLMFIDLDRFKQVNDVHGHNVGDVLLQTVAARLRHVARPGTSWPGSAATSSP